jgi:hypothetical protein
VDAGDHAQRQQRLRAQRRGRGRGQRLQMATHRGAHQGLQALRDFDGLAVVVVIDADEGGVASGARKRKR